MDRQPVELPLNRSFIPRPLPDIAAPAPSPKLPNWKNQPIIHHLLCCTSNIAMDRDRHLCNMPRAWRSVVDQFWVERYVSQAIYIRRLLRPNLEITLSSLFKRILELNPLFPTQQVAMQEQDPQNLMSAIAAALATGSAFSHPAKARS